MRRAWLMDGVRGSGLSVTLIVTDATALASIRRVRTSVVARLHAEGIVLKDGSGELHPSATTLAIAEPTPSLAACSRKRRSRGSAHG